MVSGINHGANSSINVIYSGTMSAAVEASIDGMKAIGFSLCDYAWDADFESIKPYIKTIALETLKNGLPYGTLLEVTNKSNGKKAVVRVNDRGPHRRKVLLDLSYAAAKKIGIVRRGIGNVRVRVLSKQEIPNALYASARN
jgi:5'/3'-nucleotidase SurE